MNYYFDFFTYANIILGNYYHLANDLIAATPHNPIVTKVLSTLKEEMLAEEDYMKPIHFRRCLAPLKDQACFQTGPHLISRLVY